VSYIQDPSKINGDNLNNIRHEPAAISGIKRGEYLKDKPDELATKMVRS
jgi:hypothetical protein